jgi:hypothetical protein
MMRSIGAIDENTPVITTVHDCQVTNMYTPVITTVPKLYMLKIHLVK